MNFEMLTSNSFWAVPLVVALVEVFKMSGFSAKYAPLISLLVGIGLSFIVNADFLVRETLLAGVIYGLSASGLYSGVKVTKANKNEIVRDFQENFNLKSGDKVKERVVKEEVLKKEVYIVNEKDENQNNVDYMEIEEKLNDGIINADEPIFSSQEDKKE